ncbi:NAD(P)H-dependent glycerol-3-phosphate dehydrogenase [Schaalia sp. lx-100]|uniref:NAD(P)H-dependent glycerol-3-phosphate dehydrogenase n=1 Tax=Schaalia sp. lx-100 TaxID=2899081 RepID=UPI001E5614BB|nr:NAD(P)H-dependent glycerol-3-phosphate dehydrogenase [Schaalia sp. lx-100]MCD4556651.1 glycerol-3-phosphate dehydrogenase [Schaalia sp. lx-100]
MATITILGAGAMGSALCKPLVDSGWNVRLWGTWLDDHLIDAIEEQRPHPRTGAIVPAAVTTFRSDEIETALAGSDVIVMSVASVGVPHVTELALTNIAKAKALWLTSKGFCPNDEGVIQLLPDAIRSIAAKKGIEVPPIVAIAGPVKANECAEGMPTATIFACRDGALAEDFAARTSTPLYSIASSDDEVGVEVCAPMKNVYAIALGIADGLGEATGIPHHNLKAAAFAQAVKEMSLLGHSLGAKAETAFGLAGVGDLEVTGLSGRNKVYGVRLGKGENPQEALAEMERLEQTVEGVPAVGLALTLVEQSDVLTLEDMPLLRAVAGIIDPQELLDPLTAIQEAALPRRISNC